MKHEWETQKSFLSIIQHNSTQHWHKFLHSSVCVRILHLSHIQQKHFLKIYSNNCKSSWEFFTLHLLIFSHHKLTINNNLTAFLFVIVNSLFVCRCDGSSVVSDVWMSKRQWLYHRLIAQISAQLSDILKYGHVVFSTVTPELRRWELLLQHTCGTYMITKKENPRNISSDSWKAGHIS